MHFSDVQLWSQHIIVQCVHISPDFLILDILASVEFQSGIFPEQDHKYSSVYMLVILMMAPFYGLISIMSLEFPVNTLIIAL